MEKLQTVVINQGDSTIVSPVDMQFPEALKIVAPTGKQRDITKGYTGFRDFNTSNPTPANNSQGEPYYWTSFAGQIMFDKPADQTYSVQFYYIKVPATLTADTDVPSIPEFYQEALVLGAFYRALQHNEDYDLAATIQQAYDRATTTMAVQASKRQTGTPNVMSQPLRIAPYRKI